MLDKISSNARSWNFFVSTDAAIASSIWYPLISGGGTAPVTFTIKWISWLKFKDWIILYNFPHCYPVIIFLPKVTRSDPSSIWFWGLRSLLVLNLRSRLLSTYCGDPVFSVNIPTSDIWSSSSSPLSILRVDPGTVEKFMGPIKILW